MTNESSSHLINHSDRISQTIRITHEAIAQELGSSREVISRILKAWEKQGIVSLS